ncbi:mammalian cell entry protein [Zobellella denitrificans]|uniref:Mammalian cell entry protein n=1 Tax=Zobellella denitrificans TaxID=347534 RepID=A0A291HT02_9GAMM|nr:MlaD family protein [Zobellella denitrificans]ATG75275.1 mammalian cell entry protein [Zobellella denitrificans]
METRAHHVLIGVFTLAVAAAVLLFALWLAKAGGERDARRYDILFREPVSGLSVGSAVQYSGIRVGEVERLTLDPDDPRQVWARVRIAGDAPVKTDTRARLALTNITGAAHIELSQGSPESPLLARDDEIPVIVAEPSPLARLRLNSEELLLAITTLVDNANRMLSEDNARHLGRVLANLDATTSTLAAQQDSLAAGLQSLAAAGDQLQRLLARLDAQAGRHGEPMLASAAAALANLERTSRRLDALLADNRPALDGGLQGLAELGPAIQELRRTLATLGDIARRLEQDPAGYLLGRDDIEEFKP